MIRWYYSPNRMLFFIKLEDIFISLLDVCQSSNNAESIYDWVIRYDIDFHSTNIVLHLKCADNPGCQDAHFCVF